MRAAPCFGIPVFLKEDFGLDEVGAEPVARAQHFRAGAPEIQQDVERIVHAIRLTVLQVQLRDPQPEAGLLSGILPEERFVEAPGFAAAAAELVTERGGLRAVLRGQEPAQLLGPARGARRSSA